MTTQYQRNRRYRGIAGLGTILAVFLFFGTITTLPQSDLFQVAVGGIGGLLVCFLLAAWVQWEPLLIEYWVGMTTVLLTAIQFTNEYLYLVLLMGLGLGNAILLTATSWRWDPVYAVTGLLGGLCSVGVPLYVI